MKIDSYYGGIFNPFALNSFIIEFKEKLKALFDQEYIGNFQPLIFGTGISGAGYITTLSHSLKYDCEFSVSPLFFYFRNDDDLITHGSSVEADCEDYRDTYNYVPIFVDDSIISGKTLNNCYEKLINFCDSPKYLTLEKMEKISLIDKRYYFCAGHYSSIVDSKIYTSL